MLSGCGEASRIMLYYSASLWGNLDGCTCKSRPRAGLVKRAWFLNQIGDKSKILLVDGGDILFETRDDLLASYILDVYRDLNYAAVGVGFNELVNGTGNLAKYREIIPYISNNIALRAQDNRPFSDQPLMVHKGKYDIGIFSLFDPGVFDYPPLVHLKRIPAGLKDQLSITPVDEAARSCVENLDNRKADLVILLYFGFHDTVAKLVQDVPGIDIVILAFEQNLIRSEKIGDTYIYSPGEEGNRLGMLEISETEEGNMMFENSFILFSYFKDTDDPKVRSMILDYEAKMRGNIQQK